MYVCMYFVCVCVCVYIHMYVQLMINWQLKGHLSLSEHCKLLLTGMSKHRHH